MSAAAAPAPGAAGLNGEGRFSATMVLSLLVHGVFLLGVGYALESAAPVMPTLDVILTQTQTALTPKQADFMAQASNQGGGEHDKSSRPRENQSGPAPQPEPGVAARALQAQSPAPAPPPQARVISSSRGETVTARALATTPPAERPLPVGPEKIERDIRMARLAAEIHLRSERYAKRPKRKFVSASTQEYAWAGYLRSWVDRVERVGNLNYPDEARRRRLQGQVVISVAVRRDGSVERADIVQSSGIPLLDASALRIARLAEPYPPLPRTDENPDILHVTRTWQFLPDGALVDE
ncbi:energy transducer TonB [Lysobacter sp. Root559]|nr:energy transducer TonB [Lysobacter sp. Root559]KRA72025.1 energy transducer TonB [Lysobacter sp. Root667]KRC32750.1 energy transducer TonB [Lysobacter sp. Root76]KRD67906.1 energy transducer TonB [Lysobacter sp. Root96]